MVQPGDHQLRLVVYPLLTEFYTYQGELPTQTWFISSVNFVKRLPQKGWKFQLSISRGVVLTWSRERVKISKEPVFVFFTHLKYCVVEMGLHSK